MSEQFPQVPEVDLDALLAEHTEAHAELNKQQAEQRAQAEKERALAEQQALAARAAEQVKVFVGDTSTEGKSHAKLNRQQKRIKEYKEVKTWVADAAIDESRQEPAQEFLPHNSEEEYKITKKDIVRDFALSGLAGNEELQRFIKNKADGRTHHLTDEQYDKLDRQADAYAKARAATLAAMNEADGPEADDQKRAQREASNVNLLDATERRVARDGIEATAEKVFGYDGIKSPNPESEPAPEVTLPDVIPEAPKPIVATEVEAEEPKTEAIVESAGVDVPAEEQADLDDVETEQDIETPVEQTEESDEELTFESVDEARQTWLKSQDLAVREAAFNYGKSNGVDFGKAMFGITQEHPAPTDQSDAAPNNSTETGSNEEAPAATDETETTSPEVESQPEDTPSDDQESDSDEEKLSRRQRLAKAAGSATLGQVKGFRARRKAKKDAKADAAAKSLEETRVPEFVVKPNPLRKRGKLPTELALTESDYDADRASRKVRGSEGKVKYLFSTTFKLANGKKAEASYFDPKATARLDALQKVINRRQPDYTSFEWQRILAGLDGEQKAVPEQTKADKLAARILGRFAVDYDGSATRSTVRESRNISSIASLRDAFQRSQEEARARNEAERANA